MWLARWRRARTAGARGVSPPEISDPLATRVSWRPAKKGGSLRRTYRLEPVGSFEMAFRATLQSHVNAWTAVGLCTVIGVVIWRFELAGALELYLGGLALLCGGSGLLALYSGTAPIVFDKQRGVFFKARVSPFAAAAHRLLKHPTPIEQIHALQVVSETCMSDDESYDSYELNLVLHDGSRVNLIDHRDLAVVRREAGKLGAFLERPIWDAVR